MNKESIFEAALAMNSPWYIDTIEFDDEQKRLDIFINFERGSHFESKNPEYPGEFKAYDTKQKQWRHLNFFEHECYLHCRVPRIKPAENKIELISPPWEGRCPGFTLLFEALALELATHMPVLAVSKVIGETEYTGNKFSYEKDFASGFYNQASYIMTYHEMRIKEIKE